MGGCCPGDALGTDALHLGAEGEPSLCLSYCYWVKGQRSPEDLLTWVPSLEDRQLGWSQSQETLDFWEVTGSLANPVPWQQGSIVPSLAL